MTRALTLAALLALAACDLPTSPRDDVRTWQTPWGTVTVSGAIDLDLAGEHLERGIARVEEQGHPPHVEGLRIAVDPGLAWAGSYHRRRGTIRIAPGWERAIAHEYQHHYACTVLGRSGSCCTCQDHRGSASGDPDAADDPCAVGYMLDCSPYGGEA